MRKISKSLVAKGLLALFCLVFLFHLVRLKEGRVRSMDTVLSMPMPALKKENTSFVAGMPKGPALQQQPFLRGEMSYNRAARESSAGFSAVGNQVAFEEEGDGAFAGDSFEKIIKSAELTIQVKNVQGAYNRILGEMNAVSGFVLKSDFSQSDPSVPESASLVLEVPSQQFDTALVALSKIGKITSRGMEGEDVTADFVDLQSRLKHLGDVETQLTEILTKARTITDILTVQNQLNQVQEEMEQIKGRMQLMAHKAAMSQISVDLAQILPVVKTVPPSFVSRLLEEAGNQFEAAAESVLAAFTQTITTFMVMAVWIVGYLFPILLAAYLLWKFFTRHAKEWKTQIGM